MFKRDELIVWLYTCLKLDGNDELEQFLSQTIEKIILNPYPLLEKTTDDHR
jgi:hypothetical protein